MIDFERDLTADIKECDHIFGRVAAGQRRCIAGCGVVLVGSLVAAPPAGRIDWRRCTLANPNWKPRWVRAR